MKRKLTGIGIFMLVLLSQSFLALIAQEKAEGQWTAYTSSEGLPFNEVAGIAFGPGGDLWCVFVPPGGGGLAHFDGKSWKHFTTTDGLGSDAILWLEHTLAVSSDNVLWVATFGGGVSRFDGEEWINYTTEDGLLSDQVTALAIAPNGDLWCTHVDCGISHFDGESWAVTIPEEVNETSCHLMNIAFGSDSALWLSGSHVLRYQNESWTNFSTQAGMEIPLYMEIGPDGKIWIGAPEGGVTYFEDSAWTHYSMEDMGAKGNGSAMPLAVDYENVLWVGVSDENDENDQVLRFDGQSWTKFEPVGGPVLKSVYSIEVGPDSTIWFGTHYGLFRYNERAPLVNLKNKNKSGFTVYPNPFNDKIVIKGNRSINAYVSVFNIMGIKLLEERCEGKNEFSINTKYLPGGMYIVQIASGNNLTAFKLSK